MKKEIIILSLEKMNFANKETGEVSIMTKVVYGCSIRDKNDNFIGYDVLVDYVKNNQLDKLSNLVAKIVSTELVLHPTDKGIKFKLKTVNGQTL